MNYDKQSLIILNSKQLKQNKIKGMKRLEPDTYYILSLICLLFVMNRFDYSAFHQKYQIYIVLFMGIIFLINALSMTFQKEKDNE